jgi:hypothetical protein
MKFFLSRSNGVVAVISEEHVALYATVKKSGGDPIAADCRVFTFCSKERVETGIARRMTFTGTYENLEFLIEASRHHTQDYGTEWDGYVSFSNGTQYG